VRPFTKLIGLLGVCLAAAISVADSFGRYGYGAPNPVPGFQVDRSGFRARAEGADRIGFATELPAWRAVATSAEGQTVGVGQPELGPTKLRFDLWAPGFAAYFPQRFHLRLTSIGAPYLTWMGGSVSNGVPTPAVPWAVLSFRDAQPPIILGFPDGTATLKIEGKPGDWRIESNDDFVGWMRIGLPVGIKSKPYNAASALGELALESLAVAPLYVQTAPVLRELEVQDDRQSVTATWKFDRKGAVVPLGATLANIGGYPLRIQSGMLRLNGFTDEGPVDVSTEDRISIRFPIKRIPTGRAIGLGAIPRDLIGTASPFDVGGVTELAFENLASWRDMQSYRAAEQVLAEYLSQSKNAPEPVTEQNLPYGAAGEEGPLVAAHAFLMQALESTKRAGSENNALFTSLAWRRDALTWRFVADDEMVARRTSALAALVGLLCPEPERRLESAMFEAGVAAQRGQALWRVRIGALEQEPAYIEPWWPIRKEMFGYLALPEKGEDFARMLLSPFRIYGDAAVELAEVEGKRELRWNIVDAQSGAFTLATSSPLGLESKANLVAVTATTSLGFTEVRYAPEVAGQCVVRVNQPPDAAPVPPTAIPPRYSEPARRRDPR